MAKNDVYYYDKNTLQGYLLGEVQDNFNISFVIDGTKDSAKFIVYSFNQVDEIEPYTILWHNGTNTWWVVSHDKVEKYVNESGYLFKHELQVLGLIELLNARDLTDCGFYANNYTISSFLDRLLKLSNLEFYDNLPLTINSPSLDLEKNIDYTKTFENYTLLNALRELFDGYNCAIKMSLTQNNEHLLTGYTFNIISKTGDNSLDILNEDDFNSVKETKNMNQNSFGTIVVSNAENVISTKSKTYPAIGTVKLSSTQYEINKDNAILRLPTKIYKVNWLQLVRSIRVNIRYLNANNVISYYRIDLDTDNYYVIKNKLDKAIIFLKNNSQEVVSYLENDIDSVLQKIQFGMRTTLYSGWRYDPINNTIIPPKDNENYYQPMMTVEQWNNSVPTGTNIYYGGLYLAPGEVRDTLKYTTGTISYQRGNDYLENFNFLCDTNRSGLNQQSYLNNYASTDLRINVDSPVIWEVNPNSSFRVELAPIGRTGSGAIEIGEFLLQQYLYFRINYIPMNDIKIKYDNSGLSKDTKLYNQNGKLNDSVGLSKLLLSYSKEIEGDTITKFGTYYNENDIPKVGQIVLINSNYYVINNVSLDYFENEDNSYYIVAEFTMSKNISTKSIMTNPNTNVRDYGIPQNLNVKRKQLYRDFYELSHEQDIDSDDDFYMPLYKICNFGYRQTDISEHIAVIKLFYDESFGGDNETGTSNTWYYQLDTTAFALKKQYYEVLDFKDNNIIGYGSQNVSCGFDIRRIFNGITDNVNTPIQYTDDNGKVKSFNIAMCNDEVLQDIYMDYIEEENFTREIDLFNYSVFIDSKVYEGGNDFEGAKDLCDFMILETNYNKDPIEVPVFEYACQIDDSNDVIIGENILDRNETDGTFYKFLIVNKNTINQNNWNSLDIQNITNYSNCVDCINFETTNDEIKINFYENEYFPLTHRYNRVIEPTFINAFDLTSLLNKDIVIIRTTTKVIWQENNGTYFASGLIENNDLMFVIRNVENANIEDNKLTLKINHYKIN